MSDADAPQFDRQNYQDSLRLRLEGLEREKVVAFAARCAWRAAPWLISGERSQDALADWSRTRLPKVQAALTVAILWESIALRDDANAAAKAAAMSTDILAVPEPSEDAGAAAAAAAYVTYASSATYADAATYAAFTALHVEPETRRLMQESVMADLSQLKNGNSAGWLLNQPLWKQIPNTLQQQLGMWEHIGPIVPEAAIFLELLQSIHHGTPNWKLLRYVFTEWWEVHPKNLGRDKVAESKRKASPPESKTRRITEFRLVSTTSVAADAEAEHLTQTAQRYMLALREFLVSDETHPPLTVAVEAPWGGGKSSLMRHLQDSLTNAVDLDTKKCAFKEEAVPTVWFNPWKHEAGKTLWAAFAVAFERQMAENCGFYRRQWKRACLSVARLEAMEKIQLALRFMLWGVVLFLLGCGALQHFDMHLDLGEDWKAQLLKYAPLPAMIAALWAFLKDAVKQLGSPLKLDVSRLLTHNDHADKVDDLHRFHEDFRRMIRAYIPQRKNGKAGKAVVFIDDLDRCEAPKAAELLQSLHQMLNVQERSRSAEDKDAPGIICVLGMDREKVAAAVAAKHEKLLPLLMQTDVTGKVSRENAMIFGYEFLEKFIQLTLHLPPLQGRDLEEYLASIVGTKEAKPRPRSQTGTTPTVAQGRALVVDSASTLAPADSDPLMVQEASERREQKDAVERIERVSEDLDDGRVVLQCARYAAASLENNPRKLKQFVNLFRLRLYLAAAMNFLDLPDREAGKPDTEPLRLSPPDKLSVHHLAKLVAFELAAPSEMTAIREKSSQYLFGELEKAFPADTKPALHALVAYRDPFEPEAYDLSKAALHAYFHCFKAETPPA